MTEKPALNRNQIKYIAITAMIFDHIAMFFMSGDLDKAPLSRVALYSVMRVIGRLTAPVMLFFLVEGFIHTSSRKKYGIRLLIFGLISQIPYSLAHYNSLFRFDLNVIITLFMTFLMLNALEKIGNAYLGGAAAAVIAAATFCCDWGIIGPIMAWLFYYYRDDRKAQLKSFAIVSGVQVASAVGFLAMNGKHWYGELWQAGMFLVIPLLLCYNGEAGKRSAVNKWVFYIFYPLHLLVIWAVKYLA